VRYGDPREYSSDAFSISRRLNQCANDHDTMPSKKKSKKKRVLTALEFFAGSGGLSLGVHNAGFTHLALIERDRNAAETLRQNSQSILGMSPDLVKEEDAAEVDLTPYIGITDLLTAGPPCQPFSTAGKSKGYDDPRNMFPVLLDAISLIMPKAILIENVKGLLRKKFKDALEYIKLRIKLPKVTVLEGETWRQHYARLQEVKETDFPDHEQYIVSCQLIDTADYGAAQRRERVFIIAFRRDLGIEPMKLEPTHSKVALLSDQWITGDYWKRHGVNGVPPDDHIGKKDRALLEEIRKNPTLIETGGNRLPWVTVREALSGLPDPVHRGEEPTLANHVQHPGARTYAQHSGSYLDYPAKALKAGSNGTPGGENMLRISSDGAVRYFTTRESGRLQGFPDEWEFQGVWGACIRQLGNAVPVTVVEKFAIEIRKLLESVLKKSAHNKIHHRAERVKTDRSSLHLIDHGTAQIGVVSKRDRTARQ
jgi:DNA (cytosine-5)-methyltransferase 1